MFTIIRSILSQELSVCQKCRLLNTIDTRVDHSDYKITLSLSRKLSQWRGFSDFSQNHKTLQKKISVLQFSITQSSSFTKNLTEKGSKIHKKHLVDPEVG